MLDLGLLLKDYTIIITWGKAVWGNGSEREAEERILMPKELHNFH